MEKKHIVVLGAGFGGIEFCQDINTDLAFVSVVDRQNHHLFQPLLYQVASAGLSAPDIAQPIRSILKDKKHLAVYMDEVQSIDLKNKRVKLPNRELFYDYLVIGLGAVTGYFNHPEWEQFAPGLKTIEDAMRMRSTILSSFEKAESEFSPDKTKDLLKIVVIGGGPTGVELAGSFSELARFVLSEDFDHIKPEHTKVILIEAGPRILPHFPEDLSASAQKQLEKLGVEVRLNCPVLDIQKDTVILKDETIHTPNIIWGAGVKANPITQTLGPELDRGGRIKVNPDLSVPGHPEVFAVGDIAGMIDKNQKPVPGVAQGAMQSGKHVAKMLNKELKGESNARSAFSYWDKGNMATIGRSSAIAQIGKLHLKGFSAWLMWLFIHLIFLVDLRNKSTVLINWVYSYFTYGRGSRVIFKSFENK